jgi:hypothetical protein
LAYSHQRRDDDGTRGVRLAQALRLVRQLPANGPTWMTGTRPVMTIKGVERPEIRNRIPSTGQPWLKPGHDVKDDYLTRLPG